MTAVLYCSPRSFSFLNNKSKLRTSNHPLSDSPYADLLSSTLYIDIEEQFKREFCTLMGTSQDPALQIVVNVGSIAIPTMIKLRSVMDERRKERPKVEMWSVQDELPVIQICSI